MDRREYRRRLATRPKDVRFEEIERLLGLYGWELATIRGSHHVFKRDGNDNFEYSHSFTEKNAEALGIVLSTALSYIQTQPHGM